MGPVTAVAGAASEPPVRVPPVPVGSLRADPRPLLVGAVAAALCAVCVVAVWERRPYPAAVWLPIQLAGFAFIASGTISWHRVPGNRIGPLMVVVGSTWYIGNLQLVPNAAVFAVSYWFFYTDSAVLGHLLISLPDGRLHGRAALVLAVLLYAAGPLTQVPRYFDESVLEPQLWGDPTLSDSVWADAGSVAASLLAIAVVALVALRWRRAARPVRRRLSAAWATLAASALASVVMTISSLRDLSDPLGRAFLILAIGVALTPLALIAGLVRASLQRLRVADLVVELGQAQGPEEVRDALARALDDPTLEILYWLPEPGHYVHGDGRPEAAREDGSQDRAETVVESHGHPLAKLVHDPELVDERIVVAPVVAAARLALQNAHLEAAAQAQLHELRASRARLVAAADSERRRIQRDLHDGAQHRLLELAMMLGRAEREGEGEGPMLTQARTHLGELMRELRELTQGILPPVLEEQGLAAALGQLTERAPLPVCVRAADARWPRDVERTAYFVVTEALANVYKHAGARSASVSVTERGGALVVEILDDGCGGAVPRRGSGLQGLEDRAQAAGGALRLTSVPGTGTVVRVELPCGR